MGSHPCCSWPSCWQSTCFRWIHCYNPVGSHPCCSWPSCWQSNNNNPHVSGEYTARTLWDLILAVPGPHADKAIITIQTNITIQELKVKTYSPRHVPSQITEPQFYGGFKFCDVTGRGSDVISYICRCEQPEMCKWIYFEVNQAQPNSIYTICEVTVV